MALTSPNNTTGVVRTIFLFTLIFLSVSSPAISTAYNEDKPTMEALFSAVTPTPLGWSSTTHFCDWRGVKCDVKNRVFSLTLPSQSLSGTLPSSLNSLTHITILSIGNNHFSGPLPYFANLSRFRKLHLHNNSFTSIPKGAFSSLINLQILSLSNNIKLSAWNFPSEILSSPKIIALLASNGNMVGSIPDIFGSFPRLVNLTLSNNNLTGTLPNSFNGSGIRNLKLDNQKFGLTGNIDHLSGMSNLSVLWLQGNNFTGYVPSFFNSLSNLSDVRLEENNFIGSVPPIRILIPILPRNVVVKLGMAVYSNSFPRNQVYIRANNVGNVGVAPPPADLSSEKKPNVGAVVGLTFLLVFVILAFAVWICWKRRSASRGPSGYVAQRADNQRQVEVVTTQPPVVVPPPPRNVGMKQEAKQPPPPPPPQDGVVKRREGKEPLPPPPPPPRPARVGDMKYKEGKQPPPPPPPQDGAVKRREGKEPLYTTRNGIMMGDEGELRPPPPPPQDRVIKHRERKQPPPPPPQDGVMKRRDGKEPLLPTRNGEQPPPPPPPRDAVMKRKVVKQQQHSPEGKDVERRQKRGRDEKQQQRQETRDEELQREHKKGRDAKSVRDDQVAKEQGKSLGLPNKYTYEYLKLVTNNFAKRIGGGTFGNVYKGTLSDGTTMVAVKCLKSGGAIDDFKNQVEVLGRAHHPNLVKLLGYCDDGILRILVYEYMINRSLERWIFHSNPRRSLAWPERKNIIIGIARGLVHLHDNCDKTILHRDLKPANVVLDGNKNAKLCDFGLSKLLDKDKTSTSTAYAGTRSYMAPEVKQGKRITEKVDVYSFGILVLEVLFGKRHSKLVIPGQSSVELNQLPDLIYMHLSEEMQKNATKIEWIGSLAVSCIRERPEERPSMRNILAVILNPTAKYHEPKARRN